MKHLKHFSVLVFVLLLSLCCNTMMAQVVTTKTSVLKNGVYGPELIVNGGFEEGNSGFVTEYNYQTTGANTMVPEGTYGVGYYGGDYHSGFKGTAFEGQNYMLLNGHTNATYGNGNAIAWEQTVSVEPGKAYEFSFMLNNLNGNPSANLSLYINDVLVQADIIAPVSNTNNIWEKHIIMWENASAGTAKITFKEITKIASGNDFGFDNISLRTFEPEPAPCPTPEIEVVVSHVSCPGGDDGSISIWVTGIEKPYDTQCLLFGCEPQCEDCTVPNLKSNPGFFMAGGLTAGEYTYRLVKGECEYQICITVTEPEPLQASATPINALCNGLEGSATITINGGTMPYTLSWAGNTVTLEQDVNTYTIEGLLAGSYSVTVSEAHNCGDVVVDFTVTEPAELTSGVQTGSILCFGGTTFATVNAAGGTAPYKIMNGELVVVGSFDGMVEVGDLTVGAYSWTVVDANGCESQIAFEITQPALLEADKAFDPIACYGGTTDVTVSAQGGTGMYSLYNGEALVASFEVNTIVAGLGAGNYNWIVKDENGCADEVSFEISQPDSLIASFTFNEILCNGNTTDVTVSAQGGTGMYSLYDGETLVASFEENTIVAGLGAGEYSWTVSDVNGCEAIVNVIITEPELIVIGEVNATDPLCYGDSAGVITIVANGGTGVLAYSIDGVNFQENGIFENLPAGTYTVTVIDENECVATTEEIIINNPPQIILNITSTNVTCNGFNNGSIQVEVVSPGSGFAHLCLLVGCDVPGDCETSLKSYPTTFSGLAPGVYQVTFVDVNGCVYTECVTITEPTALVVETGFEPILCNGNSTDLNLSVSGGTAPYSIYNGESLIAQLEGNNYTFNGVLAGLYNYNVVDANECVFEVEVEITQPLALEVGLEYTNVLCNGGETTATVTATGGTQPINLYDGETLAGTFVDGSITLTVQAGDFNWTVRDANGCEEAVVFTVTEPALLEAEETVGTILCNGGQADVTVNALGGTAPYGLYDGETLAGQLVDGSITLSVGAGEYSWMVIDENGCEAPVDFVVTEPLTLTTGYSFGTILCNGGQTEVVVTAEGGTTPYELFDGATSLGQLVDGAITLPVSAGEYSWMVIDENGCEAAVEFGISQPELLVAGYSFENIGCYGGSSSAVISAVGGTAPYSVYSNGEYVGLMTGNEYPLTLLAGTYSYTVIDANGCESTVEFTIVEPEALGLDLESPEILCAPEPAPQGDCVAYSVIEFTQGLQKNGQPVVADRSNPEKALGAPTNNAPGEFVSLGFGGSIVLGFEYPIINGEGNDIAVKETSFGNPDCGSWPEKVIAYAWDAANETWVALNGGVAVCRDAEFELGSLESTTMIKLVDATNPASFGGNADGYDVDAVTCLNGSQVGEEGPGEITANVTGGTPPYTYAWSNGENTQTIGGLQAGEYSVVVTDANGCTIGDNYTIVVPDPIVISSETVNVSCFGLNNGSALINIIGGTAPYTLEWAGQAAFTIEGGSYMIENLGAGSYTIFVVDANNCPAQYTFVIEQPALLEATQEFENVLCYDGTTSVIISAQGGVAPYRLFNGETSVSFDATTLVENVPAGTYNWTVTDANGCEVLLAFEITQPEELTAEAVVTNPLCNGEAGMVDIIVEGGTQPYTIMWDFNPEAVYAGLYDVTVVDGNECSIEVSFEVSEPALLTAGYSFGTINCYGGTTEATVTAQGGTAPYFLYDAEEMVGELVEGSYTVEGLVAGQYDWTIIDNNGCSVEVSFAIDQPTAIEIEVVSVIDPLCFDAPTGSITVAAVGGTGELMYSIDGVSYQSSGVFENLMAGTYTVSVMDANQCIATEEVIINNPPQIIVEITTTDVSCFGMNDGSIFVNIINPGAGLASLCLQVGCEVPCDDCGTMKSTTATYAGLAPGIYQITYVDQNGCTYQECVEIGEPEPLVAGIENQVNVLCNGGATGEATVMVSGGTAEYTYLWSNGQTTATVTGLAAGEYTVVVTDAHGCTAEATVTISEPANALTAYIEVINNVACFGETNGSAIVYPVGGVMPYTYLWNNGETTQQIEGLGAGEISVVVTDANGCMFEAQGFIAEPAALAASIELQNVVCEVNPAQAYASEWLFYLPGNNNLGGAIVAGRDNPANALGAPDNANANGGFVSLGFGGKLVLKFAAPVVNVPGSDDIYVSETTFGTQNCNTYPEQVRVYAAQIIDETDPLNAANQWVELGQGCLDANFQLPVEMPWAQYFLLVDESNAASFSNSTTSDGYDVDGIVALNGTLNVSADIIIGVTGGTPSYNYGSGMNSNLYGVGFGSYTLNVSDANGCIATASVDFFDCAVGETNNQPLANEENMNLPSNEVVLSAYPNPFSTEATISFQVPESAFVTLEVYNLVGEKVAVLYEGNVEGMQSQKVKFNGQTLSNGVYFYRLNVNDQTFFNKIVLTK